MPTSLVTGGAGFLGSHLCEELLRRGHRLICVDNLETGSVANIEHIRGADFALRVQNLRARARLKSRPLPKLEFSSPNLRVVRAVLSCGADRLRLPPGLA